MEIMQARNRNTNVSQMERLLSLVGGSGLVAYGLTKRNPGGLGLAAIGGGLLWRGISGHCDVYQALGVTTAERDYGKGTGTRAGVAYQAGIRVDHEMPIQRPPEELYRFWRNLENLPRFMNHLQSVNVIDDRTSHWVVKGPAGFNVEWDAEIINDIPNQLLGWRSLEGSRVDNAGSVRFEPMPDGAGTVLKISLQYNPPAGQIGALIARAFSEDPQQTIIEDLRRFKELMETGNIKSTPSKKTFGDVASEAFKAKPKGRTWDRDTVTHSSEESFPASDPPSWTPETL